MKKYFLAAIIFIFGLTSCEKEEIGKNNELNLLSQEYFNADINGKKFSVQDNETMGGIIYPSRESGVITFDFWGAIDTPEHLEIVIIKICFFDGPGTYHTGNTSNVSYADYWLNDEIWYNDYRLEDPGEVIITEYTEDFVEGTFEFNAFNYDGLETYINAKGKFKVLLEEN